MLAAPEEAISDRLGVLPADVSAPDTALPGLDANEVLAPLDEETAPQDEAQAPQAAPANSAAAFSLDPLAAPAALGDSQASPAPSQAAAPLDLAAPESALPETVTSADAANVSAPQSQTGSVDTPVSDASEVTAPGVSEAPQVGASPSSGAIDVAAPSELSPSLPTPITSTAEPITSAAPPIGWEGEESEEDVDAFTTKLTCEAGVGCYPTNLGGEAGRQLTEIKDALGDLDSEQRAAAVAEAIAILALSQGIPPIEVMGLANTLSVLGPDHQVRFLGMLEQSLSSGQMNADGFYTLSREVGTIPDPERALSYLENVEYTLDRGGSYVQQVEGFGEFLYFMQPYATEALYELLGAGLLHNMHRRNSRRTYSSNTPDIVSREMYRRYFQDRELQIRQDLKSLGIKRTNNGNVGVANIDIPGSQLPRELKSFSRVGGEGHPSLDGYVTLRDAGARRYQAYEVSPIDGKIDGPNAFSRAFDTEYKILDSIDSHLKGDQSFTGSIDLYTTNSPCASCQRTIDSFATDYPNISITVYDSKGGFSIYNGR